MRLTPRSVENAAVYYLRRFPATEGHLRRVLMRKAKRIETDLPKSDIDKMIDDVVAAMARRGLVDDEAFARAMTESLHRRGDSRRLIAKKLAEKLVPSELARAALERLEEDIEDVDLEAAWAFARRRRLGPFRRPEQRAERRTKDLAALARRGFSYRTASTVIDATALPD